MCQTFNEDISGRVFPLAARLAFLPALNPDKYRDLLDDFRYELISLSTTIKEPIY